MDQVAITDARDDLAEVVNRVTYRGDRVVLTRRGKRLVAVVPIADLELLERLENAADLEEIRSALCSLRSGQRRADSLGEVEDRTGSVASFPAWLRHIA
jgi:prevent-host-death family protein